MRLTSFLPVLVLSTFTTFNSFSQSLENADDYQHDIGFNTSFILNGLFQSIPSGPFDVMYKHQEAAHEAARFGLGFSASLLDGNANSSVDNNDFNLNISLLLGKEWQSNISEKWIWYAGGDIIPALAFFQSERKDNDILVQKISRNNYDLNFRPFAGIRFQINERLYVATEAAFIAKLGWQRGEAQNFDSEGNGTETPLSNFHFSASLTPASGVFLFYRFN